MVPVRVFKDATVSDPDNLERSSSEKICIRSATTGIDLHGRFLYPILLFMPRWIVRSVPKMGYPLLEARIDSSLGFELSS